MLDPQRQEMNDAMMLTKCPTGKRPAGVLGTRYQNAYTRSSSLCDLAANILAIRTVGGECQPRVVLAWQISRDSHRDHSRISLVSQSYARSTALTSRSTDRFSRLQS